MSDEQLQFAISQYVDGTLPPAEATALEKRLQEDPAARRLLEEYRRINDLIDVALPEPEVDWDQLSTRISAAIDREAASSPVTAEEPATYRISAYVWKPLAMAAAVLICATVALLILRNGPETGRPDSAVAVNPGAVSSGAEAAGTGRCGDDKHSGADGREAGREWYSGCADWSAVAGRQHGRALS